MGNLRREPVAEMDAMVEQWKERLNSKALRRKITASHLYHTASPPFICNFMCLSFRLFSAVSFFGRYFGFVDFYFLVWNSFLVFDIRIYSILVINF